MAIDSKKSSEGVNSTIGTGDDFKSDYSCAICRDILIDPVVGECGHDFCKCCLEKWLAFSNGIPKSCPVCRHVLKADKFGICCTLSNAIKLLFPEDIVRRRKELECDKSPEGRHERIASIDSSSDDVLSDSTQSAFPSSIMPWQLDLLSAPREATSELINPPETPRNAASPWHIRTPTSHRTHTPNSGSGGLGRQSSNIPCIFLTSRQGTDEQSRSSPVQSPFTPNKRISSDISSDASCKRIRLNSCPPPPRPTLPVFNNDLFHSPLFSVNSLLGSTGSQEVQIDIAPFEQAFPSIVVDEIHGPRPRSVAASHSRWNPFSTREVTSEPSAISLSSGSLIASSSDDSLGRFPFASQIRDPLFDQGLVSASDLSDMPSTAVPSVSTPLTHDEEPCTPRASTAACFHSPFSFDTASTSLPSSTSVRRSLGGFESVPASNNIAPRLPVASFQRPRILSNLGGMQPRGLFDLEPRICRGASTPMPHSMFTFDVSETEEMPSTPLSRRVLQNLAVPRVSWRDAIADDLIRSWCEHAVTTLLINGGRSQDVQPLAKQVELALYMSAASRQEYADMSSLDSRVNEVLPAILTRS